MNYHQFNPSTDTLEVGTEFDFAGRKGTIIEVPDGSRYLLGHKVSWEDANVGYIDFTKFTSFLIKDKPAKPLTIDKMVKGEIIEIIQDDDIYPSDALIAIHAYLNSLEET